MHVPVGCIGIGKLTGRVSWDNGRKDIRVCNSELQITLAPLSSPHRTLAAQALCDILNKTATVFPGSSLRMRFAVHPPRRIGLAFPGSPGKRGAEKVAVAAA